MRKVQKPSIDLYKPSVVFHNERIPGKFLTLIHLNYNSTRSPFQFMLIFGYLGFVMSTLGSSNPECLTIIEIISNTKSDAARAAVSPVLSYGGETYTTPPTAVRGSRRRIILRSSRVVHPPDSGVPIPGQMPGSITSMLVLR